MGLNCKVKRSYKNAVESIKEITACAFKESGKLCNPEAGSFAEECANCKRFQ